MSKNKNLGKVCPYCGKIRDIRGIFTHVMQSSGGGHGVRGEVPNGFDTDNLKVVSPHTVRDSSYSKVETATKRIFLCNWCNELCKGERGYKIHLGNFTGGPLHPEDATIDDGQFTLVPCDDNWNPFMDLDDVYRIQERRRSRESAFNTIQRPVHTSDKDVGEQIATLLSKSPEMEDDPRRVMSIFGCDKETFQNGLELYKTRDEFS